MKMKPHPQLQLLPTPTLPAPTTREAKAQELLHNTRCLLVSTGPMTIWQLTIYLHVSRQTATRALRRMQTAGEVYQRGYASGGRGPPARLWAVGGRKGTVAIALERLRMCCVGMISILNRPVWQRKMPSPSR